MSNNSHLTAGNGFYNNNVTWRFYLIIMAVTLTVYAIAYWSTLIDIVSIWWNSRTFNHGFIVVPITLYLIWKKRDILLQQTPNPSRLGWIALIILILMWVVAYLANVQLIQQFAVVFMLPILVYVLLGREIVKSILFPLGFLIFAIPFGEFTVPMLQDITAIFTVEALRLTGIPVYLEGRFISIPSGNFKVAEACSGVRYLIASITLGTLYAYLTYYSLWRRSIFILLSVIVPIAANSLRAFGIVMLAHMSDYELATGFDHLIYGWLFFGVVMVLLFWVGSFFKDDPPSQKINTLSAANTGHIGFNKKANITLVLITAVLLISGPLAAQWLNTPISGARKIQLPLSEELWSGPSNTNIQWKANFEGATLELNGEYMKGQDRVQLYVAYYAVQTQGTEIVNSENTFYDKSSWRRTAESIIDFEPQNGQAFRPGVLHLASDTSDTILWHWYEVGGISSKEPLVAKLAQIRAKLLRETQAAAVVIVRSEIKVSDEQTLNLIRSFVDQMLPALKNTIYQ